MNKKEFDEKVINYFYDLAISSEEADEIMKNLSSEELDELVSKIDKSNEVNYDYNKNGTYK
ncbi:MAG: hypothetical protein ACI4VT_06040 [Bacilli bacterium]